jgi:hypothetical protein
VYNNGAHKHQVVRSIQTSLNTMPKPRVNDKGLSESVVES